MLFEPACFFTAHADREALSVPRLVSAYYGITPEKYRAGHGDVISAIRALAQNTRGPIPQQLVQYFLDSEKLESCLTYDHHHGIDSITVNDLGADARRSDVTFIITSQRSSLTRRKWRAKMATMLATRSLMKFLAVESRVQSAFVLTSQTHCVRFFSCGRTQRVASLSAISNFCRMVRRMRSTL